MSYPFECEYKVMTHYFSAVCRTRRAVLALEGGYQTQLWMGGTSGTEESHRYKIAKKSCHSRILEKLVIKAFCKMFVVVTFGDCISSL